MALQPGTRLGPYEIVELRGKGGMGEVYRAKDTRLGRDVAVKVLPTELSEDASFRRRFEREAKTISHLQHPNVCTLYDVGSEGGVDYLVMEFLVGQTLEDRLAKGAFSIQEVSRIGGEIAEAIEAAHRRGVVHRDLKPANVILTETGAKVLDFGLAREVTVTDTSDAQAETLTAAITKEGKIAGTMPYMAPEQLEGAKADSRSDIWSLGCILYEMATGERPFQGDTQASLIASILKDPPGHPSRKEPLRPERLDLVVQRCLEKDAERRWHSAKDLSLELESLKRRDEASPAAPKSSRRAMRLGAIAAVLLAVIAGTAWLAGRRPAADVEVASPFAEERCMIVVLPLDNLGPTDRAYFATGISQEITGRLGKLDGVSVISRNSAAQYAGKTIAEIREALDVDYVLTGSVQWASGERVQIRLALTRARDETEIWSESYDAMIDDMVSLQFDIANDVSVQLGVTLLPSNSIRTSSTEAYDLYLNGVAVEARPRYEEQNQRLALQIYQQAVALDGEFALAWAKVSEMHVRLYQFGYDRVPERLESALHAANQALAIEPGLPEAFRALGLYHRERGELAQAERELEKAVAGLPNDSSALEELAIVRERNGSYDEAIQLLEKAVVLDPRSADLLNALGSVVIATRDYERADAIYEKAMELAPDNDWARAIRYRNSTLWRGFRAVGPPQLLGERGYAAFIAIRLGNYKEALANVEAMSGPWVEGSLFFPRNLLLAWTYTAMGEDGRAEEKYALVADELEALLAQAPDDDRYLSSLGLTYAGLGQREEALGHAKRAVQLRPHFRNRHYLGWVYALVGDANNALDIIEEQLAKPGWFSVAEMEEDPFFDNLREHSRYQSLVEQYR